VEGAAQIRRAAVLGPLIVALIITLHEHVVVKFEVDGVVKLLLSIIGVKQGDLGAPKLFTFFIAAVMETWRSEHPYELCIFRTRDEFKMTGRQPTAHGDEFAITDSEYADDTGLPFPSRAVVEEQTPKVIVHFGRWGLEVHSGVKAPDGSTLKDSKSEILFCAARPHCYTDPSTFDGADLSDVLLPGKDSRQLGSTRYPYRFTTSQEASRLWIKIVLERKRFGRKDVWQS
jgi:hypothetical protein